MRPTLTLALLVALASPLAAQEVKFEKYELDNGMTVILHEDHALPTVAINTWFKVGSRDEAPGRSGFAHLFEHLMFMGTRRVPGNDFDKIMERGGGGNNATTSEDRTNYFSAGPAGQLRTLLWLDADRLEDLGRSTDKTKLDRQRDVVRNERRQTMENHPYGKSEWIVQENLFPPGHPYHIPVLGTHADLEAATLQDVKDFFANHYVPCNASLVVAGDFDAAKVKPIIAKLFGTIPRGVKPERKNAAAPVLTKTTRLTTYDKVEQPLVQYSWHSPGAYQPGDAEMELAAAVLADGATSRLYKRLVRDEKLAVSVNASQNALELGSTFAVQVFAKPDADLDKVEASLDDELEKLCEMGVTEDELASRKAQVELAMMSRLESLETVADKLNEYQYFFGDPGSFGRDLERYRKATVESVRQYARCLKKHKVAIRVLPEEPDHVASARDEKPKDEAPAPFAPRAAETFKLANGIEVRLLAKPELPLVAARIVEKPAGPLVDAAGKKAGLARLAARMLKEGGAGELDAVAFQEALQAAGAELDASADRESAVVSFRSLKSGFEKTLALAATAIRKPRFDAKEWERVKDLHLESLKEAEDEPSAVARVVGRRLLFGDASPHAWPDEGTPESVKAFGLDDVKRAHGEIFRPETTTILLAGALTKDEAKAALDKALGDWKVEGAAPAAAPESALPSRDKLVFAFVERQDAVQTVIHLALPAPRLADEKRVELELLNVVLGGCFTSRLNANLREAHGYTYGMSSRFHMGRWSGAVDASTAVRADVTGASLEEVLGEFAKIRKGDVTDVEAEKARETLRSDTIGEFQSLAGSLATEERLLLSGLDLVALGKDLERSRKVGAAEINALAKTALPVERGVLVLVGDRKTLEQVKKIDGLPEPIELDAWGLPKK